MMKAVDAAELLRAVAVAVREQREYLTQLDAAIGDGDHGHNLDKGFQAVVEQVLSQPPADLGKLFQQVAMALISTVGGASGPLYGTAFLRMGGKLTGREEVSIQDLPDLLEAAIGGIQQRGRAQRGEKTMLDALIPAQEALRDALAAGADPGTALGQMAKAAAAGVEYTKTIRATKGRASYLGDRSIGHADPGAASSALILRTVYDYAAGR